MTQITIKEYFALAGSKLSDKDARVIGPVLAELSHARDVDAAAVVEAAKSANCPLHAYFEWDNAVAAGKYREGQAEDIINTVRVRFTSADDGQERTVRAYRIAQARSVAPRELTYKKTAQDRDVLTEAADQEEIIAEALRELQEWRIKYRPYAEQCEAFKEVGLVILNQISEFVDECVRTSGQVRPLEAVEDLKLWAQQHRVGTGAAGQFAEHFKYMLETIEEAERAFDPDARIEGPLARDNRLLRERIVELVGNVPPITRTIQVRLGLTKSEANVLAILLERSNVDTRAFMRILYPDRDEESMPDDKIIDVFVCKVRKKIGPLGLTIETIWCTGYLMPAASKARLRDMLTEQPKEAVA